MLKLIYEYYQNKKKTKEKKTKLYINLLVLYFVCPCVFLRRFGLVLPFCRSPHCPVNEG